jgi:Bifunctional DNA primase/polymerase, N-terminal
VFPLEPLGKRPIVENGFKAATCDPNLIGAWWERTPNANIGMPTGPASEILVLDVDPEHGGNESLQALPVRPITWTVQTPSGGWHYWWKYPADVELRNTAGKLGPGLDTRGEGGYVVLPPSVGHNGRHYEWMFRDDLAAPPRWLVESLVTPPRTARERASIRWSLEPSPYGLAALTRELGAVAIAAVGTRNSRLFYAACRLGELEAGGELPRGSSREPLISAGLEAGLGLIECEHTVDSGLKTGADNPRSAR